MYVFHRKNNSKKIFMINAFGSLISLTIRSIMSIYINNISDNSTLSWLVWKTHRFHHSDFFSNCGEHHFYVSSESLDLFPLSKISEKQYEHLNDVWNDSTYFYYHKIATLPSLRHVLPPLESYFHIFYKPENYYENN